MMGHEGEEVTVGMLGMMGHEGSIPFTVRGVPVGTLPVDTAASGGETGAVASNVTNERT